MKVYRLPDGRWRVVCGGSAIFTDDDMRAMVAQYADIELKRLSDELDKEQT